MNTQSILAELRANPDKIFHLLRENDFARARILFGDSPICRDCGQVADENNTPEGHKFCSTGWHEPYSLLPFQYHLSKLILAPDVLGYLAEYGKEGE